MPQPLMDRMEIIRLSGYTEDEKVEIAQGHLLPKAIKDHGLKPNEFSISEDALRDILRYYTRESVSVIWNARSPISRANQSRKFWSRA